MDLVGSAIETVSESAQQVAQQGSEPTISYIAIVSVVIAFGLVAFWSWAVQKNNKEANKINSVGFKDVSDKLDKMTDKIGMLSEKLVENTVQHRDLNGKVCNTIEAVFSKIDNINREMATRDDVISLSIKDNNKRV